MKNTHNQKIELLAFHGWGFDAGFWEPLREELPEQVSMKTGDRGYFGNAQMPVFSGQSELKVLVSHSFGLSWIPESYLKEAHFLIILNGFSTFHPELDIDTKRSNKVLHTMIRHFESEPKTVLNSFWRNTFAPDPVIYKPMNEPEQDLLLSDLQLLNNWEFKQSLLPALSNILCIDAEQDQILQSPRGKVFTQTKKGESVYHLIQGAGHALPITHAKDCWSFINAMFPIFTSHGNH